MWTCLRDTTSLCPRVRRTSVERLLGLVVVRDACHAEFLGKLVMRSATFAEGRIGSAILSNRLVEFEGKK